MRFPLLNHEVSSVHTAALILGFAVLLSRMLGVLRNRLLASSFGAGRELDVYYAAFQIPDFMSVLFLLGAASVVIIPVLQEYVAVDRRAARDFISAVAMLFFLASLVVALAAFLMAPLLVPLIAPGFSVEDQGRTISLTRIVLVSPILLGLSSIFSAVVQSFQRFFVYALAPILYNIGIMIGIVVFVPIWGFIGLGMGVALGALLHLGVQLGSVVTLGFGPRLGGFFLGLKHTRAGISRVAILSLPRVFTMSLSQLTLLALVAIGSLLSAGSITVFAFAQDIYFVPVGIFGLSYAVALFPRLARSAAARDGKDFFRDLATGIRGVLFWAAPSAALFLVLRAHIVRASLGAGAFSWEDTRLTAAVLAALTPAIVGGALQGLLLRGFYALGTTYVPLIVNVVTSVFSVGLAVVFLDVLGRGAVLGGWLGEGFRIADLAHTEVLGLGLGFALGTILNTLLLFVLLVRQARRVLGAPNTVIQRKGVGKIFIAALAAGVVAYLVRVSFSEALPLITFIRVLVQGAAAAAAGFGAYWGTLALLGSEDLDALRLSIARRLFSIGVLPKSWDGGGNLHE